MELIFHKSEKYIEEDIFYYISDQRDKHSMIKPKKENLICMTVDSKIFTAPNKKEISNAFYPFKKNSIDKIYIGLSFPLFSNNWAASYLRHLLKVIKKDGAIILPVYPEEQADEKGMWSRSFLENIFTSRTGWTGTNNVWAENDGVMSMRIGKNFPKKMNSTFNFFIEEIGNKYLRNQIDNKVINEDEIIHKIWSTSRYSAIVEKIIRDNCNNKNTVFCDIGDNPSLSFEINVSKYIKLKETLAFTDDDELFNDLNNYFMYRDIISNKKYNMDDIKELARIKPNIISIIYNEDNIAKLNDLIKISPSSIFIVRGNLNTNDNTYKKYNIVNYSSIVATKLNTEKVINHYSDIIESEINNEFNSNQKKLYLLTPK
jgi:hypothetical protein